MTRLMNIAAMLVVGFARSGDKASGWWTGSSFNCIVIRVERENFIQCRFVPADNSCLFRSIR